MLIERDKFIELMGDKPISGILKKLRDSEDARRVFSNHFGVVLPDSLAFHGSPEDIEEFHANVSLGGANANKEEALIYASSEPDYAIFLALLNIQEGGSASVTCESGEVRKSITVGFVNGESKIGEGYVYVFDGKQFISHDNAELTSNLPGLQPVFSLKATVADLESPIVVS
jgi:hypothetical protein